MDVQELQELKGNTKEEFLRLLHPQAWGSWGRVSVDRTQKLAPALEMWLLPIGADPLRW